MGGRGGSGTATREPDTSAAPAVPAATPIDRPDIAAEVQREMLAMSNVPGVGDSVPVSGLRNRLTERSRAEIDTVLRQMARNKMISLQPAARTDSADFRQSGVLLQGVYHTRVTRLS